MKLDFAFQRKHIFEVKQYLRVITLSALITTIYKGGFHLISFGWSNNWEICCLKWDIAKSHFRFYLTYFVPTDNVKLQLFNSTVDKGSRNEKLKYCTFLLIAYWKSHI